MYVLNLMYYVLSCAPAQWKSFGFSFLVPRGVDPLRFPESGARSVVAEYIYVS